VTPRLRDSLGEVSAEVWSREF